MIYYITKHVEFEITSEIQYSNQNDESIMNTLLKSISLIELFNWRTKFGVWSISHKKFFLTVVGFVLCDSANNLLANINTLRNPSTSYPNLTHSVGVCLGRVRTDKSVWKSLDGKWVKTHRFRVTLIKITYFCLIEI